MNGLALHLILALVWALFLGEVSLRTLSLGFVLGLAVLVLFQRALRTVPYVRALLGSLSLVAFFLWELLLANLGMARLALQARPQLSPMVVAVPLRLQGEGPLTLLAALTGLMPGTVALGFSPQRDRLYVHAAGLPDRQAAQRSVQMIEDRILRIVGPG